MKSKIASNLIYFRYVTVLVFIISNHFAFAQENNEKYIADNWLNIDPQGIAWPAFSNTPDVNGHTISFKALFNGIFNP